MPNSGINDNNNNSTNNSDNNTTETTERKWAKTMKYIFYACKCCQGFGIHLNHRSNWSEGNYKNKLFSGSSRDDYSIVDKRFHVRITSKWYKNETNQLQTWIVMVCQPKAKKEPKHERHSHEHIHSFFLYPHQNHWTNAAANIAYVQCIVSYHRFRWLCSFEMKDCLRWLCRYADQSCEYLLIVPLPKYTDWKFVCFCCCCSLVVFVVHPSFCYFSYVSPT